MKKHITKLVLLLAFTSVAISSCSLQYRERRANHRGPHDGHDNYNNGHRPDVNRY